MKQLTAREQYKEAWSMARWYRRVYCPTMGLSECNAFWNRWNRFCSTVWKQEFFRALIHTNISMKIAQTVVMQLSQ